MFQKSSILFTIGGIVFGMGLLLLIPEDLQTVSDLDIHPINLGPNASENLAFEIKKEGEWNLDSVHIAIHVEPTNVPIHVTMIDQSNTNTNRILIEKVFQGDLRKTITLDCTDVTFFSV